MAKTKGKSPKGKSPPKKPVTAAKKPVTAAKKPVTAAKKPVTAAKKPVTAAKKLKATRPSLPLPPPPPPPPAERDEMPAPRDVARLTRYGEHFGDKKIDVRWLPLQLPVNSGALAIFDPGVPKTWHVFDRPSGNGQFRAMLSIARTEDNKERLAAIVIHTGRPPIAKWTVAHYKGGKKPKSPDALPRVPVTTGWIALLDAGKDSPGKLAVPETVTGVAPVEVPLTDGRRALALPCGNGDFAAYWAVDATDKPICIVVDFDVFTQKEWKARAVS